MKIISAIFGITAAVCLLQGCGGANQNGANQLPAMLLKVQAMDSPQVDQFLSEHSMMCYSCADSAETTKEREIVERGRTRQYDIARYDLGITVKNPVLKNLLAQKGVILKLRTCLNGAADLVAVHGDKETCMSVKPDTKFAVQQSVMPSKPKGSWVSLVRAESFFSFPGIERLYLYVGDSVFEGGGFVTTYLRNFRAVLLTEEEVVESGLGIR